MGGLAAFFAGPILEKLVGGLVGPFADAYKAYLNKEISEAELKEKLAEHLLTSFASLEQAYLDSLNKTFASFMDAAKTSKLMQAVWATVALSQLVMVLWFEAGIPAITYIAHQQGIADFRYPSSGDTAGWAYALLMFCLGGGAIAMRSGPGASSVKDQIKSFVGR